MRQLLAFTILFCNYLLAHEGCNSECIVTDSPFQVIETDGNYDGFQWTRGVKLVNGELVVKDLPKVKTFSLIDNIDIKGVANLSLTDIELIVKFMKDKKAPVHFQNLCLSRFLKFLQKPNLDYKKLYPLVEKINNLEQSNVQSLKVDQKLDILSQNKIIIKYNEGITSQRDTFLKLLKSRLKRKLTEVEVKNLASLFIVVKLKE